MKRELKRHIQGCLPGEQGGNIERGVHEPPKNLDMSVSSEWTVSQGHRVTKQSRGGRRPCLLPSPGWGPVHGFLHSL